MSLVYKADPVRGAEWAALIAAQAPGLAFHVWPATGDPAVVRYLAAWLPPDDILGRFPNLQVLFSVGAGVDQLDLSALPPELPVVRMIESGLTEAMTDYATLAALALHRDLPAYIAQQGDRRWQPIRVLPASARRVGVLGLGVLGRAVLARLAVIGFDCAGWSRSRHHVDGIACFAGGAELPAFLARSDILICLLPLTPDTRGMLNADLFAALPRGAGLVNCGRGGHLDESHLLAALASGQIGAAVLDVTDPEPPAPDHPFWSHPKVLLTPHVASMTQPETAVAAILENIRRHQAGEKLLGLVDRSRGY